MRLTIGLLFVFWASLAHATQYVSSPNVAAGRWSMDARYGFEHVEGRGSTLRQLYFGEYGITRHYAQRLQLRLNNTPGGELEADRIEWDHKWQIFFAEDDGFNGGVRLRLGKVLPDGRADTARFDLLGQKKIGVLGYKANLMLGHEIGGGARDGLRVQTAWQALYSPEKTGIGLEYFGDFGRLTELAGYDAQAHQLGAVINGKLDERLFAEAGYLAGISGNAPDGVAKLILKWKF